MTSGIRSRKIKVTGNHPLYPVKGKKKGISTWRCKECHGWDYIGKVGRYKSGSHYSGIKGIYDVRNKSPQELFDAITNAEISHDYSRYLSDIDIWSLVKLIHEGLIDIKTALNSNGSAKGNPDKGKILYASSCAACHGEDGNALDFEKKKDGIQGVGWLANGNPQETLHKIRWGHPGTDMLSAIVDGKLLDTDTIDILSYCQTL
ncbi:MAG: c-type cytochrome [Planctomycetota bacterium]|jgi:thiosulfate dehydrogenase